MVREFTVVVERDEQGNFVATVPSLPGCHTQARTRDVLDERILEAIAVCLETGRKQRLHLNLSGSSASAFRYEPEASSHWARTYRGLAKGGL